MSEAVKFLEEVLALGYPCRGITSDLDTSLTLAIEHVYAEKPHQYCIKHALAVLERILGYHRSQQTGRQRGGQLRTRFERLPLRKGLYLVKASRDFVEHGERRVRFRERLARSSNFANSARRSFALAARGRRLICWRICVETFERTARKWSAIDFLERHWVRLMRHHRVHGLPRTNNMAETFSKQLKRRVKTIESFQHRETAISYLNLLVAYLSLKPYTDCRGKRKHLNGKRRLQAAGVTICPQDWLKASLKF